ncbi:MAG: FtsW/RodA/SpoVE family cell cycle protein [Phycisphaerales bacterium]|nr:FtsW/RodA/SpoVE family cell cycle protein [Phycisphaerales bacterium]
MADRPTDLRMRTGDLILILLVAMLGTGIVAVQSAGLSVANDLPMHDALTHRSLLLAGGAILAFIAGSWISPALLQRKWVAWALLALAAMLAIVVLVPGIGREVNGARRWLDVGPVGFQPSELAKWALVVFMAGACTWWARSLGRFRVLLLLSAIIGLLGALVLLEDLGTAVLMVAVAGAMLLAAGAKLWQLSLLAVPGLGIVAAGIAMEPYRMQRLHAFMDPFADPAGNGYHVVQSMAAIAGGGLGGRGLGNGIQKYGYLPEDTTDFIFAVICEEAGLGGALLVVALFGAVLITGWTILRNTNSPHHRLLCLGVLLTIGAQALMNLLVVTGLAPTKGIALPLISNGGTGWLMTAFALGWLKAIDTHTARLNQDPLLA